VHIVFYTNTKLKSTKKVLGGGHGAIPKMNQYMCIGIWRLFYLPSLCTNHFFGLEHRNPLKGGTRACVNNSFVNDL